MSFKKFIIEKLNIIKQDNQPEISRLVDPLTKKADDIDPSTSIIVPADKKKFQVSFPAIEVKKDRLVINAERVLDGFIGEQYVVEFKGTRAAYLRGSHNHSYRYGGWSYIEWDIRSYAEHPTEKNKRVYVKDFYAHAELKKLIQRMEQKFGTKNILNTYINDNLLRLKAGIQMGKTIEEIERLWSKGMMEQLGYKYVEALDEESIKNETYGTKIHWFKSSLDALI